MLKKLLNKLFPPPYKPTRQQKSNEFCKNCLYYEDYSKSDPEEPQGYCGNPDPGSEDEKYGGHWTSSDSWCEKHEHIDELRRAVNNVRKEPE